MSRHDDEPSTPDATRANVAARLADGRLDEFIAVMSELGNPGAIRHQLGAHKTHGWVLNYDPATGERTTRVIIGIDGYIHPPPRPHRRPDCKFAASHWLLGAPSPIKPIHRALSFAYELDRIRAAHTRAY